MVDCNGLSPQAEADLIVNIRDGYLDEEVDPAMAVARAMSRFLPAHRQRAIHTVVDVEEIGE